VGVVLAAAANDPGAASGVLAPPSCGDQPLSRVPRAAPRRSSLRLPLSLPGSFASLTMITPTDSWRRRGSGAMGRASGDAVHLTGLPLPLSPARARRPLGGGPPFAQRPPPG